MSGRLLGLLEVARTQLGWGEAAASCPGTLSLGVSRPRRSFWGERERAKEGSSAGSLTSNRAAGSVSTSKLDPNPGKHHLSLQTVLIDACQVLGTKRATTAWSPALPGALEGARKAEWPVDHPLTLRCLFLRTEPNLGSLPVLLTSPVASRTHDSGTDELTGAAGERRG